MPEVSPNFKSSELCKTCGKNVCVRADHSTFCSSDCKSPIFRKRIILKCDGCSKRFSIMPCYERDSNYCSLDCYRNFTRRKEKRFCRVCGKEFWPTKPLIDKGFGIFCSRECQHKTYPQRIQKLCKQCGKKIFVCPSKIQLVKFCSKKCVDDFMRDYVNCVCKNCKRDFQIPRWELNKGKGTFCSRRCFYKYRGESSLEEKMRKVLTKFKVEFIQEYKIGRYYADFYIPKLNLVVECDGEYWHLNPRAKKRDKGKDKFLKSLGYKMVRLSGQQILGNSNNKLLHLIFPK